jgi:hypothetical protein
MPLGVAFFDRQNPAVVGRWRAGFGVVLELRMMQKFECVPKERAYWSRRGQGEAMKVFHVWILAAAAATLAGCLPPAANTSAVTDSGNSSETGIVDDAKGFRVDVCQTVTNAGTAPNGATTGKCNQGKFFIHKRGDRSQACAVASSSNWATADIECEAEAQELDLAYSGIHLAYNLPSSMCSYFSVAPYYFWNYEPGTAPSALTYALDRDTEQALSPSVTPSAAGTFDSTTKALSCSYDHSGSSGPNCCEGSTSVIVTSVDASKSVGERFTVNVVNSASERFAVTAISAPGLAGTYFTFSTYTGTAQNNYYVWFRDSALNVGSDPNVGGKTAIQVTYDSSKSNADLANAIVTALVNAIGSEISVTTDESQNNQVIVALNEVKDVTDAATGTSGLAVAKLSDGGSNIDGAYFTFSTAVRNTASITTIATDSMDKDYYVWLNDLSHGVADPALANAIRIRVDYDSGTRAGHVADTNEGLATKISTAIAGAVGTEASASVSSNVVTVVLTRPYNAKNAADATDSARRTGFAMAVINGQVVTKVTTTKTRFDGKYSNCLAGPATKTQPKTDEGFPMPLIEEVERVGKNAVYSVERGFALERSSNIGSANFYTLGDHAGQKPKGMSSLTASPNLLPSWAVPNEHYEFLCYDRSGEVLARIRVKVREWNASRLFVNYRDSVTGAFSVNDNQSTDASNCVGSYLGSAPCTDNDTYPINDYGDWKDYGLFFPKVKIEN